MFFCEGISRWRLAWFGSVCTASCGCHVHCIVVRGDAWPMLLSPCNTTLYIPCILRACSCLATLFTSTQIMIRIGECWSSRGGVPRPAGAVCHKCNPFRQYTTFEVSGRGLIYIAGNDSLLRSDRMQHGPRQKQVDANNKTLLNTYMARKCQMISQTDT